MKTLESVSMIYLGTLRANYRKNKDFKKADLIRSVIENENWSIVDIDNGGFRVFKNEQLSVTRDHV